MKKLFYGLLIVAVALFGLTFSYKNHQTIEIAYYFGIQFQVELLLLLLLTFSIGLFGGYITMVFNAFTLRRKLFQANRQIRALQRETSD